MDRRVVHQQLLKVVDKLLNFVVWTLMVSTTEKTLCNFRKKAYRFWVWNSLGFLIHFQLRIRVFYSTHTTAFIQAGHRSQHFTARKVRCVMERSVLMEHTCDQQQSINNLVSTNDIRTFEAEDIHHQKINISTWN